MSGLQPARQAVTQRLVAPAVLAAGVLTQGGADEVFDKSQVGLVIGPQGLTATAGLQPERQVKVPIDWTAHGHYAGRISVRVSRGQGAGLGRGPELAQSTMGTGERHARLGRGAPVAHVGLPGAARANDQELAAKIEQARVVRREAHEEDAITYCVFRKASGCNTEYA